MSGRQAAYTGGAWTVGGVMARRRAMTPLEEQHAHKLAAWFSAQGRAREGNEQYARMVPVLAQELADLEAQIAAEQGEG